MDELLNTAPCGFLSFADDGTILQANATLAEWLGYAPRELTGASIERILSIGGRIFYQTHISPLLKLHGRAEEIYFSLKTKSGGPLPVLTNAVRRERSDAFTVHVSSTSAFFCRCTSAASMKTSCCRRRRWPKKPARPRRVFYR
jgi:PAS domain S-box-containing protein